MSSSINKREIEHFAKDSARWWDEDGPFRPLHRLNPLRIRYIKDCAGGSVKGLRILDIGCGGGLVCEPLARLGANVTGIDADAQAIGVATTHAEKTGLEIDYRIAAAETLKEKFDIVLALEIVEHVNDPDAFVASCARLCKSGGLIVMSTLNRTPRSFLLGIVAAEHILRWVPQGTHDWKKFVKPSALANALRAAGAEPQNIQGYSFDILSGEFVLSDDTSVNYFMSAEKQS